MKTKSNYLFCCFIAAVLIACNSNKEKEEPTGGPCSYETKIYPATVIKIEKKDSLKADIIFRIDDNTGRLYRDSVSWYMEKREWILLSMIEKDRIGVGRKYQYEVQRIISGSCNPAIETLKLEKYQ